MKVSSEFLNFVMEKLLPIGDIRSRVIFGRYGIFNEGLMFSLIAEGILCFKVNDFNRDIYEKAESKPFLHGISCPEVPNEVLEDNVKLYEWANISITIAHEGEIVFAK